ncbi:hypothetical protein HFN69_29835 [Rhizobium laguerreae]|uniref:hypothetical protein n=1 Tax=Rhizobium laguerreae TaxID=1076926 RepID=UPI001C90211E|nr:hypothetical protein [Rhizobium laguerreae]MBY3544008.1 hypothetical protein [Rhizobium laguerreae]MBY3550767.1 hypothetical protein [Rhizobium laguerreae]
MSGAVAIRKMDQSVHFWDCPLIKEFCVDALRGWSRFDHSVWKIDENWGVPHKVFSLREIENDRFETTIAGDLTARYGRPEAARRDISPLPLLALRVGPEEHASGCR